MSIPPTASPAASILAVNLRALLDASLSLDSQAKLAKQAKIDQKTVSRYLAGTHEATIGNVHRLAKAFDLEAWQLLTPGLDPRKPPALATQSEEELREFYKRLGKTKEAIDGVLRRDGSSIANEN